MSFRSLVVIVVIAAACGGTEPTVTTAPGSATTAAPTATTVAPATTTSAPRSTTVPASSAGTRNNPIAPGVSVSLADYDVRVVSWEPDGTEAVLDHNQFDDPPPDGYVYTLVRLAFTYTGDESGTPWLDLTWKGLGASNVASEPGDCYTIPDNIIGVPELFTGGSAEANVCLTVRESDLDTLLFMLEETFSFSDTRVFFDLP